jgi:hypothetical protein
VQLFFVPYNSIYVKLIVMAKKDTKQLLFENMEKLNPDFKSTLNEEAQRWNYSWGNGWKAVINNAFGDRFTWRVWDDNEAIPPIFSSDWADLKTFKDAEEDMFSAIMDRIGHTPKSQSKLQEIAPQPVQPGSGDVANLQKTVNANPTIQYADSRIDTPQELQDAFGTWISRTGYSLSRKPVRPISISQVQSLVKNAMTKLGYK